VPAPYRARSRRFAAASNQRNLKIIIFWDFQVSSIDLSSDPRKASSSRPSFHTFAGISSLPLLIVHSLFGLRFGAS
jgi:hypothetical protein